jgi:hypothetical protein
MYTIQETLELTPEEPRPEGVSLSCSGTSPSAQSMNTHL